MNNAIQILICQGLSGVIYIMRLIIMKNITKIVIYQIVPGVVYTTRLIAINNLTKLPIGQSQPKCKRPIQQLRQPLRLFAL